MNSLQQIKKDLSLLLEQYHPSKKESITTFSFQIATGELELLSWLKAQICYPQFYLNFRDNNKKIAAVGSVLSFLNLEDTQKFLQKNKIFLVGGIKFNGETQFILPRILLEQKDNELFIQFVINNKKNWHSEKKEISEILDYLTLMQPIQLIRQKITFYNQKATSEEWQNWVSVALKEIHKGDLTKVVLANEISFVADSSLDAKDFLSKSEKYNKGCYHFLFSEHPNTTFLGSSPERLYKQNQQILVTEAVAGTAIVTENNEQNKQQSEWLLNDNKNIHENWLVVQDIKQNLAPYVEKIDIQDREVKQFRQVQHLKQKIIATLRNACVDRIYLDAIHPTAAVAGYPKDHAKIFINKIENFDRDWYAGTLGVITQNYAEFAVTIRSAFIEKNNIRVFAGAGIVEGSIPLLEWQEIERKALGLISLLQQE